VLKKKRSYEFFRTVKNKFIRIYMILSRQVQRKELEDIESERGERKEKDN
jgi:hypothetical protein